MRKLALEELVGAEKIVTKQGFVEEAFLDPCRGKVVSHRHTSFLRCCGLSMWSIWPHGFSLLQQVDKRPLGYGKSMWTICLHWFLLPQRVDKRPFHLMCSFWPHEVNCRSLCMAFLPPSGGVFRLSFSRSSPGIPYRRSCGFQGPTGKTASSL